MDITALHTPAGIGQLFRSNTYAYTDEADLEQALYDQLADAEIGVRRQVRLSPQDRIDLVASLGAGMLGLELGIEIKVKGDRGPVWAQLRRYAASPHIDELMIATTQRRHLIGLPEEMHGKTLHLVHLRAA